MRIVYVGNFLHSWCTEVHVSRDAERIPGVHVMRVQEPAGRPVRGWDEWLRELEVMAADAELLIYQKTWGLPFQATATWGRLESRGCKTISYHLDLYIGLKRGQGIVRDPFWRTGVVFTADGDPGTTRHLAEYGIDHRWMPAAIVSDEAHAGEPAAAGTWLDVVFVGSAPKTYHSEWPWRAKLLDAMATRYGNRFAVLPNDGNRIHGSELASLYATVPVVIGDSLALPGHTNYWSDRFYETVGRGGFLIGPNVPGIAQHFTSGEHLDLYDIGDLDHVFELVGQALADREAVRSIAQAGMAHVAANHTYTHRVCAILSSLGMTEIFP